LYIPSEEDARSDSNQCAAKHNEPEGKVIIAIVVNLHVGRHAIYPLGLRHRNG
jgi:hypothetical protein